MDRRAARGHEIGVQGRLREPDRQRNSHRRPVGRIDPDEGAVRILSGQGFLGGRGPGFVDPILANAHQQPVGVIALKRAEGVQDGVAFAGFIISRPAVERVGEDRDGAARLIDQILEHRLQLLGVRSGGGIKNSEQCN